METIFQLTGLLVLPFWLLMILLPRWQWTRRIMKSILVIVPAALLYVVLMISQIDLTLDFLTGPLPPTLPSIQAVLGTAVGATIAAVHFRAFDLFVGRWVYLDSRKGAITAWLISPILLVGFTFPPLGFLLCLAARWLVGRGRSQQAIV